MPFITITPIPYNGGTLNASNQRHMCRLTESRFFCIYGQTSPNYTLGMVVEVDDIRAASPVTTLLRTQVISELPPIGSVSQYRVARLNDTDILVFRATSGTGVDISVIRIDPGTNVITKVGNSLTETGLPYSLDLNWQTGVVTSKSIAENIVMYTAGPNTGTTVNRASWDSTGLVLSKAVVYTYPSFGANVNRGFSFTKSRDNNYWQCATSGSTAQSSTGWVTGFRAIGDPVTGSWTGYSTVSTNVLPISLPINATETLLIKDSRSWRAYTGSTEALNDVIFCPTAVANVYNRNVFATWLNSDYFMVLTSTFTSPTSYGWPGSWPGDIATGVYARIVKYTDPTFGETSSATTANVSRFTDFIMNFASSSYDYISPDVVLVYGRTSQSVTGAFKIGILYSNSV